MRGNEAADNEKWISRYEVVNWKMFAVNFLVDGNIRWSLPDYR